MVPDMHNPLIWPVFVLALLTFAVWLRMFQSRVGEMKRRRIHPQAMASSAQTSQLEDTRAADNFRNLFELPVLFYVAVILAIAGNLQSTALLVMAWAFVLLRILHSVIHCSYNRVMHRFRAYVLGGFILWAMWGLLLWSWLG
jgi:hypothetical protein